MKKFNQIGETIIEVLLSIVVLGFTISIVFVVARNSLFTGQAAGERTQALTIVESQIERLKFMSTKSDSETNTGIFGQGTDEFCISAANQVIKKVNFSNGDCDTNLFPDQDISLSIAYSAEGPDASSAYDNDTFTISAIWNRVGGGDQPERIVNFYRLHPDVAVPQASVVCENPNFNFSDYANTNVSVGLQPGVLDVVYRTYPVGLGPPLGGTPLPLTGTPPVYTPSNTAPKSNPDSILDSSNEFFLNPACNYSVNWEAYCTRGPGGVIGVEPDSYADCLTNIAMLDQTNEAAWIEMYGSYTGSSDNAQCTGPKLARFNSTDDSLPSNKIWNGTTGVTVFIDPSTVRCIEIVHVCVYNPALCVNQLTISSSVYFHSINLSGTPK